MTRGCNRFILSVLLAAVMATGSAADLIDENAEVVSLYARGERMMAEGNFREAAEVFEELAGRYNDSPNLDLFVFNRAKSYLYLGDYDKAIAGFEFFVDRYDNSPYVPHAIYLSGDALYLKGLVNRAVQHYLRAYNLAKDQQLQILARKSIVTAFENARETDMRVDDFDVVSPRRRCQLIMELAPVLTRKGQSEVADQLRSRCSNPAALADIEVDSPSGAKELSFVLPFSGELQMFGEQIYNGAVIAAEMYANATGRQLRLVKYDTHGDPVDAARITRDLVEQEHILSVVGPLTSEEAAVASASLSCGDLPLMTPTATEAGLTQLSSTSFQLSPNIELQGIIMADYAVDVLGADSAAVLVSTSVDEMRMARAFVSRFEERNGEVVAFQRYRARDRDFGTYIRDIKRVLLGLEKDSVFYINQQGDTLDPDGIPAHLDVLYMPGSPQQLRQLLPQINFYNLSAEYLGSDGWGDEVVYKLGDNVTKEAVFPSPFITAIASEERNTFAAAYDTRYGGAPPRLARLGYDATRLITRAMQSGADTREEIVQRLSAIQGYEGASGIISFGRHRENIEMPIFRIVAEQVQPVSVSLSQTDY